jgi:hypothetical protein
MTGGVIQIPGTPNVQPRPKAVQLGPEQLVPALLQQGLQPQYAVGKTPDGKIGFLVIRLGPVSIPMAFDVPGGHKLIDDLTTIIEQITLENAAAPDPALEQLLAESRAAVGGPAPVTTDDDLTFTTETDLIEVDGDIMEIVVGPGQPIPPPFLPAEACADSPVDGERSSRDSGWSGHNRGGHQ